METTVDWHNVNAAVWRPNRQYLRPVKATDPIRLHQLIGIDTQKAQLVANTERFIAQRRANNVLLWGARGMGKSSLIKAMLNEYAGRELRLIEVDKRDLVYLPEIVDEVRETPQRFIVFCDDLSFESGDDSYKDLKSALEGSVELPPENVLIYATSNRRHLLPEQMSENRAMQRVANEIHPGEAADEKLSLSDRFGLWLSFYPITMQEYLNIVDGYFPDYRGDRAVLHEAARQFALARGVHSGRTAKQFRNSFALD